MKEVVNIHIGQGGIQVANAVWELYCAEHGIEPTGRIKDNVDDTTFATFFAETPKRQFVPRAVFVDLEPTVVDEIRTGSYRALYHPDHLINGLEDAANNYARGHFTMGKSLIELVSDRIRKVVDTCDTLQGFFITHSLGGGTGSGFSALLLEKLTIEYGKRTKLQCTILPGPHLSTSVVEPYNVTLNAHTTIEHCDVCMMQDNEAVYDICNWTLGINRPNYMHINRLVAQVMSSLTVSLRYESSLNYDLNQMETNLIPYPRIHFPIINYAPILSEDRACHEQLSACDLTRSAFDHRNQLIKCEAKRGKYMTCCLQYRGDITPKEVNDAIMDLKKRQFFRFVDWCPTGFKLGVNRQPPVSVPGSSIASITRNVCMLSNTTAIAQVWRSLSGKFDLMYAKRSFVHWFVGEGMEEGEFNEAREDLDELIRDYEEIGIEQEGGGSDDESSKSGTDAQNAATNNNSKSNSPGPVHSAHDKGISGGLSGTSGDEEPVASEEEVMHEARSVEEDVRIASEEEQEEEEEVEHEPAYDSAQAYDDL